MLVQIKILKNKRDPRLEGKILEIPFRKYKINKWCTSIEPVRSIRPMLDRFDAWEVINKNYEI